MAAVERDLTKVRVVEDFGVDLTLSLTATKDMAASVKRFTRFFFFFVSVSQIGCQISQSDQVRNNPDGGLQ